MKGHVVVAPDKFKGSLSATEVSESLISGLRRTCPEIEYIRSPVADGGEGTVDAAVTAGFKRIRATVSGPTGEQVTASYAVKDDTAIVELAEASGMSRLPGRKSAPLTASSRGVGELIAAAVRAGSKRILLGLGGSACTDGGTGMATALGMRFLDARNLELPPGGAALRDLHKIDPGNLRRSLTGITITVVADVDNPLLGPDGAAHTFSAQKGAAPADADALEAGLTRLHEIARRDLSVDAADRPGAGAAGGVGYGTVAFLDAARVEPGIAHILDLLHLTDQMKGARLVITGEGSLDRQTLRGKAPLGVATAAARAGVPVIAVCGRRSLTDDELRHTPFVGAYALTDIETDPNKCITQPGPLLKRLGEQIAADRLR
ncbi:glycerate kinase [Actinomadura spongiicola]|uniref:Glycerate kinase n=1 Tax=Actinomadura spongiicola TaxID=2303421 RepID=A0A372GPP7_9ACTN|nr:glycerate kinase [Actinomadura spongiicola]RFS87367.1 glycerate kinase [Actinomadura spongiicola]